MTDAFISEKSERLELRPLTPDDVDDRYLSWYDPADGFLKYYSASGRSFTRENILHDLDEGRRTGSVHSYVIVDRSSGRVIGNIKIGPIDRRHMTSDLVAFIGDRSYAGKGLAAEAIRLGNRIAFRIHNIRKLHGGMFEGHVASIKAYLAADWVIEGRQVAHYLDDGNPVDRILVACFNPDWAPHA